MSDGSLALLFGTSLIGFIASTMLHYASFSLNAVDFSVFDWMLLNTGNGKFMLTPTCEGCLKYCSECNYFSIHTSWIMLPLVPLHKLFVSPLFLVITHAVVLHAAVIPLWLLSRRHLDKGASAILCIAFLTCAWTGAILNYGFHFEVFFIPTGLWFAYGWSIKNRWLWGASAIVFLLVKEDGALYLLAFSLITLASRSDKKKEALGILAVCVFTLALNLGVAQSSFSDSAAGRPSYLIYWKKYGSTMTEVAIRMLSQPQMVITDILRSSWWEFLGAFLFLPLLSARAMAPIVPSIIILGTSDIPLMRSYGVYYSAPALPFLFWGLVDAYARLKSIGITERKARSLVLTASLIAPLIGGGYMKYPPPNLKLESRLSDIANDQITKNRPVCAQSGLFPHLGYTLDLKLLSPACVANPQSIIITSKGIDAFPFSAQEVSEFIPNWRIPNCHRFPEDVTVCYPVDAYDSAIDLH